MVKNKNLNEEMKMNKIANENISNSQIAYVQFNDTINNAFRYLMYQHSQHPLLIESFDEIPQSMFECRDSLIIDETIKLHELHDFIENQYLKKYCRCNNSKCKTIFYIMCNASFESQCVNSMKYVNRVIVETSNNEFDDYMIDDYFDCMNINVA